MASINDIGIPGNHMDSPPLTPWQAAVRDVLGSDTPVDTRIADIWTPWTPTLNGATASAIDARYRRTPGGLVTVDVSLTITSVAGNTSISLPAPIASGARAAGVAMLEDTSAGASYLAWTRITTSTLAIYRIGADGLAQILGPTLPFTWAAGDFIRCTTAYRAAPV